MLCALFDSGLKLLFIKLEGDTLIPVCHGIPQPGFPMVMWEVR